MIVASFLGFAWGWVLFLFVKMPGEKTPSEISEIDEEKTKKARISIILFFQKVRS
jgi:hypothetical protein